jgi:hypothetical protein
MQTSLISGGPLNEKRSPQSQFKERSNQSGENLAAGDALLAIGNPRSEIPEAELPDSAIRNPKSEIPQYQSPITSHHSPIPAPCSVLLNLKLKT